MKKLIQISLVAIIFLALNIQLINSQFHLDPGIKAEKIVNSDNKNDLEIFVEEPAQIVQTPSHLVKNIETKPEQTEKIRAFVQYNEVTDLLSTDDEDLISIEDWMLNPCEWLFKK